MHARLSRSGGTPLPRRRIAAVAISHGNLKIEISTYKDISQPAPFARRGRTVVAPQTETYVDEEPDRVILLQEGVSVGEVVESLNAIGATSRDMIAIFEAMRAAGALHAELVLL